MGAQLLLFVEIIRPCESPGMNLPKKGRGTVRPANSKLLNARLLEIQLLHALGYGFGCGRNS